MDPLANIKEQIQIATHILDHGETLSPFAYTNHACRLAELVLALDAWRRMGGFDPYEGDVS